MRNLILSTLSTLAFLIHPLSLSAQNSFSISLDMDGAAGDQAITSLNVSADQIVTIQIFGKDIQNANGLAVRFEYDASQVTYAGFDVGNVLPNTQALPKQGTNPTFVEIGIAALGGQATVNSGLVGTVRFRTTAAFSGTAIRLVRAELSRGGRFESITIDVRVELKLQVLTPDFNGDGVVNFTDFLAFAGQFGTRQGDGRYEAEYDLDSDGAIGFGDFLIFSSSFGKEVPTPNSGGSTTTVTIPDANLRVAIETTLGKARGASITQAEMASLTSLNAPNANISDLTGLAFATNLTDLSLGENQISDVSALSGLNNLKSLQLGYNMISDMSALSNLTRLEHLNLNANVISDISALSSLTNLKWLWFSDNVISDVSALSDLTRLEHLNLSANVISNISALSSLTNLKWLKLYKNQISDVSALSNLTRLEALDLSTNLISDISALSSLTNLTWLSLDENQISDVSALSGLTNLTNLQLSNNLISDVSVLTNLTNLTYLHLSDNAISDVSALSNLNSLEALILSANVISDISTLSDLTNLTNLYLSRNNISDLSPLVANTGLGSGDEVDVRNNPLSDTSLNTHIPALQNRGVNVIFSASKPGVSEKEPRPIRAAMKPFGVAERGEDEYIYHKRMETGEDEISPAAKVRRERR